MSTRLRQVVLVGATLEPTLPRAHALFAPRQTAVDPGMAEFGLTHEVVPVGNGTFLEISAPLDAGADTTAARFLRRNGGDGGYMVVIEVPSAERLRARLVEGGFVVPLAALYDGNELTQVHPRDFGTLLEADQIQDGRDWHYPSLEGMASTDITTGIMATDVAVDDPATMAARWADVFDQPLGADGTSVELDGGGVVRFVGPTGGRTGVVAFDVVATDRTRAGEEQELGGVVVRFL